MPWQLRDDIATKNCAILSIYSAQPRFSATRKSFWNVVLKKAIALKRKWELSILSRRAMCETDWLAILIQCKSHAPVSVAGFELHFPLGFSYFCLSDLSKHCQKIKIKYTTDFGLSNPAKGFEFLDLYAYTIHEWNWTSLDYIFNCVVYLSKNNCQDKFGISHLYCNESKSDGVHKLFMLWNESAQLHSITWWLCQGLATICQKLGGKVLE